MVLNLIITGIPSILELSALSGVSSSVLNLIITGIPSILQLEYSCSNQKISFKPYYNWNTFNTFMRVCMEACISGVLNLIITGIPSIPK